MNNFSFLKFFNFKVSKKKYLIKLCNYLEKINTFIKNTKRKFRKLNNQMLYFNFIGRNKNIFISFIEVILFYRLLIDEKICSKYLLL